LQSLFITLNQHNKFYPFQNKSEMSNQFNTVLIAGATGFLGFKIANAFLDKKQFTVRILARKSSDKTDQLKSKGAEVLEVDFNDPEALKKVIHIVFYLIIDKY
jgi:nucleoside-diphosphate-sugar epimerase